MTANTISVFGKCASNPLLDHASNLLNNAGHESQPLQAYHAFSTLSDAVILFQIRDKSTS